MPPEVLLPETVAHRDGMGEVLELKSSDSSWLLSLSISRILEQECLELTVSGSSDNQHWLPLLKFPRKFYCGTYHHRLDLRAHPGVHYLRVEWRMTRLGPGETRVLSAFSVSATPLKMLHAGAA